MYEDHFGFRQPPFAATPDPRFCHAPARVQELVDELVLRLHAGQGICVLTGAAGLGKTLICRVVAQELEPECHVISLAAPGTLSRRALRQTLLAELQRNHADLDEQELRLELVAALREEIRRGHPVVLLVDEAHTLSPRLLEELRSLGIQDEQSQPLLRVLLAGQPRLEETLTGSQFDALNQQIVCHKLLEPFSAIESVEYVLHRVALAGGPAETLFSIAALDLIVQAAAGNPRLLNRLCDLSLILACAQDQSQVDQPEVEQALAELRQLPLQWNEEFLRSHSSADAHASRFDASESLGDGDESANDRDFLDELAPADDDLVDDPLEVEDSFHDSAEPNEFILENELSDDDLSVEPTSDISIPAAPAATAVPLPAAIMAGDATADAGFEPIGDTYAALDPQRPRLMRTYDDQALAAAWSRRTASAPAIPQSPPEPPRDLVLDSLPEHLPRREPVSAPPAPAVAPGGAPLLTRRTIDAQLRSTVPEVSAEEYDVVEPEEALLTQPAPSAPTAVVTPVAPAMPELGREPRSASPAPAVTAVHAGHAPSAPVSTRTAGLGMLFSTLRRKLGKSSSR